MCEGKYIFSTEDIITDIFRQIAFKMEEYHYDMTTPSILTVPVVFSENRRQDCVIVRNRQDFRYMKYLRNRFRRYFQMKYVMNVLMLMTMKKSMCLFLILELQHLICVFSEFLRTVFVHLLRQE